MKNMILLVLLCAWPVTASSHPGKTDKYGGHMCLKGCEEWRLLYKEYHLHDKDGKTIRVNRNRKIRTTEPAEREPMSSPTETVVTADQPKTTSSSTSLHVTNVYEENMFLPDPLLYILVVLLLLLLVLRMNRKREEG
jgi:hypothetical protein